MAGIKDVAKLAGVSPSTVSKYLNNPGTLKPANCRAVEAAIQKLNYTPNLLARNLRVNSSRTIAVIAQEITNPFHATLYNTIRKEAQKNNYSVVLYSASDIDGNIASMFGQIPVSYFSGVIVCYLVDILQSYEFAISIRNIPSVVFSNDLRVSEAYPNTASIYIDIKAGVIKAVEHLIDLGMRNIAFLGSATNRPDLEPKLAAFQETLENHKLKPYCIINDNQDFTVISGYHSAEKLLKMDGLPDAIMVSSDIMAMGVMRYLADCGVNVPRDVLLIGCDDIIMSSMYCPAFTTVRLPIEEASKKACMLLMEQIEKQQPSDQIARFDTKLIIRETTKR